MEIKPMYIGWIREEKPVEEATGFKQGEFVVWVGPKNKITNCWKSNGQIALSKFEGMKATSKVFKEILASGNKLYCCTCKKEIPEESPGQFAGHYCLPCWEEYKKKRSRKCTLCNEPEYICCC